MEDNISTEVQIDDYLGDEQEDLPFKYSITSYGADYPVDSLIKRMSAGSIYVPAFQRGYVWKLKQASRFIESLLLGLPVPGIFLAKEEESQKLLVIDGQQRLRTLQFFYQGIFNNSGKEFALKNVQPNFEGVTCRTLSHEDKRRLDDSIIHATIVKQDEPSDDDSSIYHVFERLNTGGTLLEPQEIRACIYHGEFNNLLNELNQDGSWRLVFGPLHKRMKDQEFILRFLALNYRSENYRKPMKEFLNKYMGKNRRLTIQSKEEIRKTFLNTISLVANSLGPRAFRIKTAINAAIFDSVMVGITIRLSKGPIDQPIELEAAYNRLLADENYLAACQMSTADEENVRLRIYLATEYFGNVK